MTVREIFTLIICLFLVSCSKNKPTPGIQNAYPNPSPFIVTPETPQADPPPTNGPIVRAESAIILDANGARVGDDEADVTMTADAETFQEILSGELNPTAAFMGGKLTIDGDMGVAMKLAQVLS